MDIENEIYEIKKDSDEKIVAELFKIGAADSVSVWVDANVLMYSSRKQELLRFPNLKTVPQVVTEVEKRDPQQRDFFDQNRPRFEICHPIESGTYAQIWSCTSNYTPLVQQAIAENIAQDIPQSIVQSNKLNQTTNESTIFDFGRDLMGFEIADTGVVVPEYLANQKGIEKSWFKYHNNRERRLSTDTYLWTDERVMAGAFSDALENIPISMVLTTDNDMFSIVKQLMDNMIWRWLEKSRRPEQSQERLFESVCTGLDHNLNLFRNEMVFKILDGELTSFLKERDMFIWLYPTEKFMFYRSLDQFLDTQAE